jgi:uncharacterized membrane protein
MNERKQLSLVVGAGLIIGITAIILVTVLPPLFEGDLVVSSYAATLYENGTLTEQYTYDVKTSGTYHMLYRSWEEPLVFTVPVTPSVMMVSAVPPPGTVGYAIDGTGAVSVFGDTPAAAYQSAIGQSARRDEVGIFSPGSFSAGQYTVMYTYVLYPPVEYNTNATHLNLKLAGRSHIPYYAIRITVPADGIQSIHASPPSLDTVLTGTTFTATGSSAADQNIVVKMLGTPTAFGGIPGFRTEVSNLPESTASGSFWYDITYTLSYLLKYLAEACVVIVPLGFLGIYHWYGREKKFTVPGYLSTIPNRALRPWQVNLLFRKDAMVFDESGYYATLLDLHRRNSLAITPKEDGKAEGFTIRILNARSDDPYEQRVLSLLSEMAENDTIDTDLLQKIASEAGTSAASRETASRYQRMLADVTTRAESSLVREYIVDGRDHIVPLLLISVTVFVVSFMAVFLEPMLSFNLIPATALWGVVAIQALIAIAMPSALFGHWKDDRYREKLEWEAFRHFLSDLALIRKYAPEDLSAWGEWLIYGTALGVGDKVEEAMAALNVRMADTGLPVSALGMGSAFAPILLLPPPARGSSAGFGRGGGGAHGR